MNFFYVSYIFLWILACAMAIGLFALGRQIGILFERVAPAGALMINKNLSVGNRAPEVTVDSISAPGNLKIGRPETGRLQLLLFISPDCPVCLNVLPAMKSVLRETRGVLDGVFISDGEECDHNKYVSDKGLETYSYVISEIVGRLYGVAKLPYGVLIDSEGKIASFGILNSREHLESLMNAAELNVGSIQQYMSGRRSDRMFGKSLY